VLGLVQPARADSEPPKAKAGHFQFEDADLSALRGYAQEIAAEQPKGTSITEERVPHPQLEDAQFAALRIYAQQIGAGPPKLTSIRESKSANPHFDDAELAELREYAQQIGELNSASAPRLRVAEAESAFDALREFLGRNAQPDAVPAPAPDSRPRAKPAPRPAPQRARPATPRREAPILFGNFVGSGTCMGCHAAQTALFQKTLMGRISKTQPGKFECENCHGPGSAHVAAVGCAACHGEGGISRWPGTPSLVGQDPQYLVPAMRAYQTGQRRHELMKTVLAGVGEGELHNIAAFYARQPAARTPTPLVGDPGAGRGATGVCAGCHGERGVSVDPAWPSLAGQDAQYLADAIRAYKHGARTKAIACAGCHGAGGVSHRFGMPSLVGQDPQYLVPAMRAYVTGERKHRLMNALFSGVGESEIESMAHYYAGQPAARAQTPLVGDPSAGKAAAAVCTGCHGEQGVSVDPAWPSLAGQDSRYLADAIEAYKDGSRSTAVSCTACHGQGGISSRPGIPSLVGLDPQYLVASMKAYTNGQRQHALMRTLISGMGETEISTIAQYHAHQAPARARTSGVGDASAGKTASAACAACHGDQGVSANPAWPSLAGQDARYIADALRAYKNGSRSDATMKGFVASLDDRTINDIATYYASLRPAQPSVTGAAPAMREPALAHRSVVASLDGRAINDVASHFASLRPAEPSGSRGGGGRDPVLVRNNLLASLDERSINNVASYYATLQPAQPHGIAAGPVPIRIGMARPADGSSLGGIISYRKNDPSRRVEDNNAICLNCHERGARTYWNGSIHESRAVACTECHTIMKQVSFKAALKTENEPATCFQCHKNKRAEIFRAAHMPIREGKITCTNCHNPHGTATEALLKENSVNDNCYKCHAEKRGPFLFEHAPVRENCLSCHDAHGSNNEYMLKVSRPRLCAECHGFGHGLTSGQSAVQTIGRSCQNCHTEVHGTNSPSGALLHR
jgi:DmsE family decaheme c-type cytochrome